MARPQAQAPSETNNSTIVEVSNWWETKVSGKVPEEGNASPITTPRPQHIKRSNSRRAASFSQNHVTGYNYIPGKENILQGLGPRIKHRKKLELQEERLNIQKQLNWHQLSLNMQGGCFPQACLLDHIEKMLLLTTTESWFVVLSARKGRGGGGQKSRSFCYIQNLGCGGLQLLAAGHSPPSFLEYSSYKW